MTRSSAPPSALASSVIGAASRAWYAGAIELVLGRQVHPELEAVEQPAGLDQLLRRRLDVQEAGAGGHPLRGAVGDHAAAAVGVLVDELARR